MTIVHIYKGVIPFICLQWVGLILCILVPNIILWVPRAFFGAATIG
jgi:TRAP-type mannitol/chloroaromatic compound transport system permease large subunit